MKLCRQMVHNERQFKEYKILLSRQQCWSQTPFKDFIASIHFYMPLWMKLTNYLDENSS